MNTGLSRRIGAIAMAAVLAGCATGTATPSASTSAPSTEPSAPASAPASGPASIAPPSGEPITVGSTLSLTGAFAATGVIHQIVGEMFVERLNATGGGLLGRPVEWTVLDDQSAQDQVTALYERLISQDEVDLIMGPYATPNILSAMAVAERSSYVLPQHTAVLAPLLTYECQFPAWSIGTEPNDYVPNLVFDALESLDNPPQTVAVVANQNGSTDFVANGLPDDPDDPSVANVAEERGLEVVATIQYPPTTTDWAPIAAQIRDANPDFVFNSAIGIDTVNLIQAMQQLQYSPPLLFSLFPAPGPLLGVGDPAEGVLSISLFESNEPLLEAAGEEVQEIVSDYEERATAEGLPYTAWETQATASWNAWETLVAGVTAANSLEHEAICDALHANGADTTFSGHLTFDPASNNFWPPDQLIKQIQDGDWVVVWPTDRAAAELRGPSN
ncbi:MAG TPA: amino acid ABC transporter substrate-binding protein [Candidatus Limnocylindrales bacterium]|nr:amino acid ABC transporter substrate-binding protein [Candidatus Limnocylindrales bacterium]